MQPTDIFLTAEWRHLAMLNFEVDPVLLRSRVPPGTELDLWHGKALVSVVGFMFLNARVLGLSVPFHENFEEVNLRFYVRRKAPDGDRRGVTFVKELVPRGAIAFVARTLYNENYAALPMQNAVSTSGTGITARYAWQLAKRWNFLNARGSGAPMPAQSGSEGEFITEHYWGYARQRDGGCVEYRVEHPKWRVWEADDAVLDADVDATYGAEFSAALNARPTSAFIADGSEVKVYRGCRV